jgi:transposase InsO family protein
MDLILGLPITPRGNTGVVVFVDRLTKQILLAPVSDDTTASVIARIYFDTVFRHKGLSRVIVSDRDPRFTSHFWRTLFRMVGTRLSYSTAFHPQTDGQTERANRVIEEILRAHVTARQNRQKQYADSHRRPLIFHPGNQVLLATTGAYQMKFGII